MIIGGLLELPYPSSLLELKTSASLRGPLKKYVRF
jgi:hypothetical protein